jgi:hemolysin activation/secretion protein
MGKKLYMFGLALAFLLSFSLIPTSVPPALAANPELQQGQQPQQQQPQQQQQEQQQQQQMQQMQQMGQQGQQQPQSKHKVKRVLTGTITQQGGHCVFQDSSTNTTLRVSNPRKVKKYIGDHVTVKGTINQTAQTIHVSKVKPLAS